MKKILIIFLISIFCFSSTHAVFYSRFYWGQCTRYVAKNKPVTWWGNAKDWIKNAKAQGYKVWNKPEKGSIVVYHWPWYSVKYGHVAIVENIINKNYMIVSEMNYHGLNKITYRKASIKDKWIIWYIYLN